MKKLFMEYRNPVLLSAAFSFLIAVYSPLEIFCTNPGDFWFSFSRIFPYVAGLFALCTLVLFLILFGLGKVSSRARDIGCAVLFGVFLITYMQGNFLAGNLPSLDGSIIDWSVYSGQRIATIALWLLVGAALILIHRFAGKKILQEIEFWGSLAISALLGFTICVLGFVYGGFAEKGFYTATTNEMYDYSTDKNVVVFVVDSIGAEFFEDVLAEDQKYTDYFTDFTYYDNTVCAYPFTWYSIPYIIDGVWYQDEPLDFNGFTSENLQNAPFYKHLEELGYRMNLYEEEMGIYRWTNRDRFHNLIPDMPNISSTMDLWKVLLKMGGLKCAPLDFKRFCYTVQTEIEPLKSIPDISSFAFHWDDDIFYHSTQSADPALTDSPTSKLTSGKQFKFIHIEGAHLPYRFDEDVNNAEDIFALSTDKNDNEIYKVSIKGTLTVLNSYLQMLKNLGVYDNTAIVILSDHGFIPSQEVRGTFEQMGRQHSILLAKGFDESHPFAVNGAPLSYEDLQDIYIRLTDGAMSDSITDWKEGDQRARRYLDYDNLNPQTMTEYFQHGDAGDLTTLVPSGVIFPVDN